MIIIRRTWKKGRKSDQDRVDFVYFFFICHVGTCGYANERVS
jgi:hypothetical protein